VKSKSIAKKINEAAVAYGNNEKIEKMQAKRKSVPAENKSSLKKKKMANGGNAKPASEAWQWKQ